MTDIMPLRVLTDSTAYLPPELIERHGIGVVSLAVSRQGENLREVEMDLPAFYRELSAARELPTSSMPPLGEFEQAMTQAVDRGEQVLGIFISSEMSGTYEGALRAAELVEAEHPGAQIAVVDSRSNCMQLGMAVLEAARAAEKGADLEQAAQTARAAIPRSRFLFTPATLDYLRKGGRIGSASALLGSALRIRPILSVRDGQTVAVAKVRTQRRALKQMIEMLKADAERAGLEELIAHHIGDEAAGQELASALAAEFGREVTLYPVGPVVGLHVGPGAVGFVYRAKEPLSP